MNMKKVSAVLRTVLPLKYCGAVIVAAGNASRMGGIDKVMARLDGEPMICRTVRAFQTAPAIREIVIVTRPDLIESITELCKGYDKVTTVTAGGSSRQESVEKGLAALSGKVKLAAIQDGARPLISQEVIERTVRAAHTYGAAAPGIPVKDTIKQVEGYVIANTPDRSKLQAVQTPQVFDYDLLRGALQKAREEKAELTDDCSAVENLGFKIKLVEGDERNIKITTPLDLKIARLFLEEME